MKDDKKPWQVIRIAMDGTEASMGRFRTEERAKKEVLVFERLIIPRGAPRFRFIVRLNPVA